MSHDIYSSWAVAEISRMFNKTPSIIYSDVSRTLTAYAGREGATKWPLADGVINVEIDGKQKFKIAVEFKKKNEGLHGILTALGQAHAYLHKGYSASIIIIPREYDTLLTPGDHLKGIIKHTSADIPIGIIVYDDPDETLASPFEGKLELVREFDLKSLSIKPSTKLTAVSSKTQWAHLREGISESSCFFRYLQISKQLNLHSLANPDISFLPKGLVDAVNRIKPGTDVIKYLSQTPKDNFSDYVWRHFWFKYILNQNTVDIWTCSRPKYVLNNTPTTLELTCGRGYIRFFARRKDSIKKELVNKLNRGLIDEDMAWETYARKIYQNAHSYKEILDSGLEHLRLLGSDGKPTDIGYRFVDACERNSEMAHTGSPKSILGTVLLKHGQLNAFLHYVFKLSNSKFKSNPLAFTSKCHSGRLQFDKEEYLKWLADELANNLRVMKKSTLRGGAGRKPFQAELAKLRQFQIVDKFRIGVGIEINWPLVQKYMDSDI